MREGLAAFTFTILVPLGVVLLSLPFLCAALVNGQQAEALLFFATFGGSAALCLMAVRRARRPAQR